MIGTFGDGVVRTRGGMDISIIKDAARLTPDQRAHLLELYDFVANDIWAKHPNMYRYFGKHLFPEGTMILIAALDQDVAAFSVSRKVVVAQRPFLYLWFSNVRPKYQKMRLFRDTTALTFRQMIDDLENLPFYAFRTRNPVLWYSARRLMRRAAPDFLDGTVHQDLRHAAADIAGSLYPQMEYDAQSLSFPAAYKWVGGYQSPQHHRDPELDRRFYEHPAITNPHGAVLTVGTLDPEAVRASLSLAAELE